MLIKANKITESKVSYAIKWVTGNLIVQQRINWITIQVHVTRTIKIRRAKPPVANIPKETRTRKRQEEAGTSLGTTQCSFIVSFVEQERKT